MNKEFKTAIAPFLFEGKTFAPTLLTLVKGWPKIQVSDFMRYENLECENLQFISATPTTLHVAVGGGAMTDAELVIALVDGDLMVEYCEEIDGRKPSNWTHEEFEEMFAGIEITKRAAPPKSKWAWQMEIRKALKDENYELAAKLRDEMKGL